ncbi:unnamed protein product [Phytomonas sp. EM1]|nr:unnamed protein product [Phytomonas sp. EM1]|eukprot:CCW60526.1 unnamed protein product [Phytomonas sp. isolate EM1]
MALENQGLLKLGQIQGHRQEDCVSGCNPLTAPLVRSDYLPKIDPLDSRSTNPDPMCVLDIDGSNEINTTGNIHHTDSTDCHQTKNNCSRISQCMPTFTFPQRVGNRPAGHPLAGKSDSQKHNIPDTHGESPLFSIPPTPTKQRRTVHPRKGEARLASTLTRVPWTRPSNQARWNSCASSVDKECGQQQLFVGLNTAGCDSANKYLRNEISRKRSAGVLSQFSALEIDETAVGSPYATQQLPLAPSANRHLNFTHLSQPSQGLAMPGPASPAGYATPTVLSQRVDAFHAGGSFSQMLVRPSAEAWESNSQVDAECSNVLARGILTDYCELQELGHGSFGRVALYEEVSTGKLVAIKVFLPLNGRSDQEQRYRRERMIMEQVRGMPHIVQLGAAWEEGRIPQMYLQLEYCPGGSVAAIAEKKRARHEAWEESEVLVFLLHMAIALDALHRANIAHVDFKPDNVLVDVYGGYKLSDFGCSVLLDTAGRPRRVSEIPPVAAGTNNNGTGSTARCVFKDSFCNNNVTSPGRTNADLALMENTQLSVASVDEGDCRYLCSDMLNQKRFFKAGDMFSLGMSLYELMSGQPLPRNGEAFMALRRNVPVQMLLQRGYSERLLHLVVALLQEEPTARPTARQVLNAVRPPLDALQAVADESIMARWTSTGESLKSCIDDTSGGDGATSAPQLTLQRLRYLSATIEATSWMLNTAHQDYMSTCGLVPPACVTSRGGGRASGNPCNGVSMHSSKVLLDIHSLREDACTPTNIPGGFNWHI